MIDICIAEITSFLPESFSEETLFVRGCREIDSVRLAKVEACKSGEKPVLRPDASVLSAETSGCGKEGGNPVWIWGIREAIFKRVF